MRLTLEQHDMLHFFKLRPNGMPVRGEDEKRLTLELADMHLVCDPHTMGNALFTRITEAGRRALEEDAR